MARQEINLGIIPGDKKGDKLRIGGKKINDNFVELYGKLTNLNLFPVLASSHTITADECNSLSQIHVIIPSPGAGKFIELVSMIAWITPALDPIGGLQVAPTQVLNVSSDGDNETKDWGYFPWSFVTSQNKKIQKMTPTIGNEVFDNQPVYVCLSGGENPKSGSATIELFYLYRVIDPSAVGSSGGVPGSTNQTIMTFTNQSEVQVEHNLGRYPNVIVVDTTGRELTAEIVHESTEQMLIRLNPIASGKIIYS